MIWALSIVGGLAGLFVLFLLWGIFHRRQSARQALAEIRRIELAEIAPLSRECVDVFQRKLNLQLNLNDCDDAAAKLDEAFRDVSKLKEAFARDEFYWHFVKPVGACLGELLRLHAQHEWRKQPGEAPNMEVRLKDGQSQLFPFEKAVKQALGGDAGDLVAYVAFARTVARAARSG